MKGYGRRARESGAAVVEYVGVCVVVVALVIAAAVSVSAGAPSIADKFTCAIMRAIANVAGQAPPTCGDGTATETTGDSPISAAVISGPVEDGTSDVTVAVNVPPGTSWTASVDTGYAYTTSFGDGPATATIHLPANPGDDRTTNVTITTSDGQQVTVPIVQPGGTQNYVALGDSYSASPGALIDGEPWYWPFTGGLPYDDTTGAEDCLRADGAYPRQLADGAIASTSGSVPSLSMSSGFYSCTGATWDGGDGQGGVQAQLQQGAADLANADIVSLSLGGNDIGFSGTVKACIFDPDAITFGSTKCADAIATANDKIAHELPDRLTTAYNAALDAAPNATIYVTGYPPVVAKDDPVDKFGFVPHDEEVEASADLIDNLNDTIKETVDAVNAEREANGEPGRLVFVPITTMDGHGITTSDPYYVGVTESVLNMPIPRVQDAAYHPDDDGSQAQGESLAGYMLGETP
ncbi:MAG: GDSL-type esterase/lipase family protein [Propionibacteriaceae bacterium]|nr:GDSL-type esterase/lipase family protein [Propionibacteriaceae bacterium]